MKKREQIYELSLSALQKIENLYFLLHFSSSPPFQGRLVLVSKHGKERSIKVG
jgi:hypothetical protein